MEPFFYHSLVPAWRRQLAILALAASPMLAGAATVGPGPAAPAVPPGNTTAALTAPLPAVQEPAALPPDSPEEKTRAALRAYLSVNEPERLAAIGALNLNRTQYDDRIAATEKLPTIRVDDLVNLYLGDLVELAPDPKTYLDRISRLTWLLSQQPTDPGLLTLLFEESDRFPSSSDQVLQIRLLESEFLIKASMVQAALARLQSLTNDPKASSNARLIAGGREGFLYERLGQPEQALAAYLQSGQEITVGPQASEALLRACLLQLDMGNDDQALETMAKLRAAPPELVRQTAGAAEITELLDLTANPDRARAFWHHQEQWMPLWLALMPALGLPPPDPDEPKSSAYIENYPQLGTDASNALKQKDRGGYFGILEALLRSARWRPTDLANAAGLLYQGIQLVPEQADKMLALGAALESNLADSEKEVRKQLVQLRVAALIDLGHPEEGRDAALASITQYGDDGIQGQALARLFGLAVLRSNSFQQFGADAVRYLTETLTDPAAHGAQRIAAVSILSDLYLNQGHDTDAETLIQKELAQIPAQPDAAETTYKTALTQIQTELGQRREQAAGLIAGFKTWWQQYSVPWFAYTTTPPQSGPLSTIPEPSVQLARDAARVLDDSASPATRVAALESVWNSYPQMLLTASGEADAALAFIGREEIPGALRYNAWAKTTWHLLDASHTDEAQKLIDAAPKVDEVKADLPWMKLWVEYLKQPKTPDAQQAFADAVMIDDTANQYKFALLMRIIQTLAQSGAQDAAHTLMQKFLSLKFSDASSQDLLANLRPQMEQALSLFETSHTAYDQLRDIVLSIPPPSGDGGPNGGGGNGPPKPMDAPASWRDLNDPAQADLDVLTQADTRDGLLVTIRDHLPYGRYATQAFFDFANNLSADAAGNALRYQIFEAAQRTAASDDDRFFASLFVEIVDFDDPPTAAKGWAALAPARDAAKYPRTASFLQYYETLMKWRGGAAIDPAAAFGPLDAKDLEPYKLRLAMDYYLQTNDRAALVKLLPTRPEADFLQMPVLPDYVKATKLLGLTDALTRATDAARLELARNVVASWAEPSTEQANPVFELARVLGDPAAYPRAWVDYLLANLHNENALDMVRMDDGGLQQDWKAVLAAAESYLTRNPTDYDAYWSKARALIELGRHHDAIEPLRVYLKYSHNEDDYNDAADWLKKISAEPAPK